MFIILPTKIGFLKSEYIIDFSIAQRWNNLEQDTVDIFAMCDKIFEPHIIFAAEHSCGWITDEDTQSLFNVIIHHTYHFVKCIFLCYY